jgi:hypothetical protein
MSTVERCDVTNLPAVMCAHCLDDQQPDRPGQLGPAFEAAYGGWCAGCDDPIEPGDRIRADGEGGYRLDCCWWVP